MIHLHKWKDVLEYNEMQMKDGQIPFIAYDVCVKCDLKRRFVTGWIDITAERKELQNECKRTDGK